MEHFCEELDGWFRFRDVYRRMVEHAPRDAVSLFVEVGSWMGKSTSFMAVEVANSAKPIVFCCVDTWLGSPEEMLETRQTNPFNEFFKSHEQDAAYVRFQANMRPCHGHYTPIRKRSADAAAEFRERSIDFVFIDADHAYKTVTADIRAWLPKVKPGGFIGGDDFKYPSVERAVRENFDPFEITSDGYAWLVETPVEARRPDVCLMTNPVDGARASGATAACTPPATTAVDRTARS